MTQDNPYFLSSGKKIYVLLTPSHLIKNVRNNLKKHGLSVNRKPVLWQHIQQFYDLDSTHQIRMAPELTAKHINLPPFAPLRVKLATQVLSHSVAAGISTACSLGALPDDAMETAKFVDRMDMLFNCFNSVSVSSSAQMRHSFSQNSGHIEFLRECLKWFSSVNLSAVASLHAYWDGRWLLTHCYSFGQIFTPNINCLIC